jgi:hypothetical protein
VEINMRSTTDDLGASLVGAALETRTASEIYEDIKAQREIDEWSPSAVLLIAHHWTSLRNAVVRENAPQYVQEAVLTAALEAMTAAINVNRGEREAPCPETAPHGPHCWSVGTGVAMTVRCPGRNPTMG